MTTGSTGRAETDRLSLQLLSAALSVIRPTHIIGVDEVGRGALAGPLLAAAVAVPTGWAGDAALTDSKQLTPRRREQLFETLREDDHVVVGLSEMSAQEIDDMGVDRAQAKAQAEAVRAILPSLQPPHLVVVDGTKPPNLHPPEVSRVLCIPRADKLVPSVSAASIAAKVLRDALMVDLASTYPGYNLEEHKGYGTSTHMAAIQLRGPCAIHRRSFSPFRSR